MTPIEIPASHTSPTFSPYLEPVASVRPGEPVVIHTLDALGGRVRSEADSPTEAEKDFSPNPVTGPIFVEGAEPGDTLAVRIESIEPASDFAFSCFIPFMGGLSSTAATRTLQDPIPERTWIWDLHEGPEGRYLENKDVRVRVPWEPFMGSIGVAPAVEVVATVTPGPHGGNMDCPDVRPGSTLYLPVSMPGALFAAGDGHARQGQGELCGTALEIACRLTVTFEVEKGRSIAWPRIVSDERLMVVASAKPMEDAARIAYAELVGWLAEDYGFDRWEAYELLSQVGGLYVANMVNPLYSLVASVEKRYLQRT